MKFTTNSIEFQIDFIPSCESIALQSVQWLPQLKDYTRFADLLAWVEPVTILRLRPCFPFSGFSFPFGNQHLTNEFYSCYYYEHFHDFSSFSCITFTSGPATQICYKIFGQRHGRHWSGLCAIALGVRAYHCVRPALTTSYTLRDMTTRLTTASCICLA